MEQLQLLAACEIGGVSAALSGSQDNTFHPPANPFQPFLTPFLRPSHLTRVPAHSTVKDARSPPARGWGSGEGVEIVTLTPTSD